MFGLRYDRDAGVAIGLHVHLNGDGCFTRRLGGNSIGKLFMRHLKL
jgi:hypothetical protein